MIARIWSGYAKNAEYADAYEAMLKPETLPGIGKVPGYRGSYLLRRAVGAEVEFVTVLLWDSLDAVKAVAGENYETAVVPEERRQHLSRYDAKAAHYEIVATHGLGAAVAFACDFPSLPFRAEREGPARQRRAGG